MSSNLLSIKQIVCHIINQITLLSNLYLFIYIHIHYIYIYIYYINIFKSYHYSKDFSFRLSQFVKHNQIY